MKKSMWKREDILSRPSNKQNSPSAIQALYMLELSSAHLPDAV